jgi:hypothetical protein
LVVTEAGDGGNSDHAVWAGAHLISADFENNPPVADAGGPYWIDLGEDLLLDGTGSYDPDTISGDSIIGYAWDLDDDGQFDDASGATATVPWANLAGRPHPNTAIPVAVEVTDGFGATDVASSILIIGRLEFLQETDLDPATGEVWYRFLTAHTGFVTAGAVFEGDGVSLTLHDAAGNPLVTSANGATRLEGRSRHRIPPAGLGHHPSRPPRM